MVPARVVWPRLPAVALAVRDGAGWPGDDLPAGLGAAP